jgi:NADPH2:quinone reductase
MDLRVARYDRFAGIDELWIDEVPVPEAAPGHVVVEVQASSINPGSLSALYPVAYVPARDLAGSVVGVGEGVQEIELGDEVLGWSQDWAAHAQYVAVSAEQLIAKPVGLSWDVAGSLFVTPMAGFAGVKAVCPQAGDMVVVSGASGGVGLTSAQLAIRAGATVIGIAGLGNASHLQKYGIIPVAYGNDVTEDIRAAAGGHAVDAFIDAFGSGYVDLALSLDVPKERINTVVDYQAAKEKGVQALGTMNAGGTATLRELADLAAAGELDIPIAATYPLSEIQAAYRTLAKDRPFGRVVLHPQK